MQEDLFIELLTEDYDLLVGENFEEAAATKALTPGSNYADPGYKGVKKYPLDSEGHVRSASRFWGISSYRAGYTSSQQAHISAAIARAKKKYGIGDGAEKASEGATTLSATDLATLEAKVAELVAQVATLTSAKETAAAESNTRIAQLEAEVLSLKTELASAVEKVSVYEKEKASAEKSAKAEAFLNELHEIHPLTDEDRAGLKEKAFEACDDEGIRQTLVHKQRDAAYDARQAVLAEREAALKAREDALPAAAAPAAAAVVAPAKKDKEGEVASEEDDARTLIVPPVTLSFQGKEVTYTPGKYV
jgi:hypothetical protein